MDPTAAAQGSGAAAAQANTISSPMKPWQLLQCVSCLAQLKYCQPEQLAAVLDQVTAARPGLLTLNVQHLAALTANLARAGVRPSNAWLVALMQVSVWLCQWQWLLYCDCRHFVGLPHLTK
jgi:hypothetical protein